MDGLLGITLVTGSPVPNERRRPRDVRNWERSERISLDAVVELDEERSHGRATARHWWNQGAREWLGARRGRITPAVVSESPVSTH